MRADAVPSFVSDAQNAAIAADYVRAIVRKYPVMKAELKDLLWKVDNGEGVNVDGVADAKLKGALRGMLSYLNLRRTMAVCARARPCKAQLCPVVPCRVAQQCSCCATAQQARWNAASIAAMMQCVSYLGCD
jgi:hypothetical protein